METAFSPTLHNGGGVSTNRKPFPVSTARVAIVNSAQASPPSVLSTMRARDMSQQEQKSSPVQFNRGAEPEGDYIPSGSIRRRFTSQSVINPTMGMTSRNFVDDERQTKSAEFQPPAGGRPNNNNNSLPSAGSFFLDNSIAVFTSEADELARNQEVADRALAMALQEAPPSILIARLPTKPVTTATTTTGKALAFTQLLVGEFQRGANGSSAGMMKLVNPDLILNSAEKLFQRQEKIMALSGAAPALVDIGFTSSDEAGSIAKAPSPASFGDGIYTSNNPFSPIFQELPTKVILVARLKGRVELANAQRRNDTHNLVTDSSILESATDDEICVLRRSAQCVPLLKIDASELDFDNDDAPGNDYIHRIHCLLQRFVDETFNAGRPNTIVTRVLPSETRLRPGSAAGLVERHDDAASEETDNEAEIDNEVSAAWLGISAAESPAIPPTNRWTLHSLVYYAAPTTIPLDQFCVPTEKRLRNLLPNVEHATKRCLICNKKGSDTVAPGCDHPFHIACLFKRLRNTKRNGLQRRCPKCVTASAPPLLVPNEVATIDPTSKAPAVVLGTRLDLTEQDTRLIEQQQQCHSSAESLVTIVAATTPDGQTVDRRRLTLVYVCGATFDVHLNKMVNNEDEEDVAATWSGMFHDAEFLQLLRKRALDHVGRCPTCASRARRGGGSGGGARLLMKPGSSSDTHIQVGTMPSGTMRVDVMSELTCSGHPPGTLLITYCLEGGVEANYHKHPGRTFESMYRQAYLPNNRRGRLLLKRLTFAFYRGLTFVVVSGETTTNIGWGAIPHKTSLSPGEVGYPDPSYLTTANEALDSLGVPPASML